MNRFAYHRADSVDHALQLLASGTAARVIAGGTNLVDLMKYEVERPAALIDITRLPLSAIEEVNDDQGGQALRIGALVSNSTLAYDERINARYPLLASAILAGATAQLRNAASTGGNLLQRTRCYYFYDVATPCNKRAPGSGCGAIGGVNRIHAILGASDSCIATHPSDMCVALAALEAVVIVQSAANGERRIPFAELHRLPGEAPEHDHTLQPDELIVAVELPASTAGFGVHHTYLKLRDRQSYAFALVSVAAALEVDGDTIRRARIALGGVAHKPWRVPGAEHRLEGATVGDAAFNQAADALLEGAQGHGDNDFKIELARRAIRRALQQAAAGTPQSQVDKRIQ
ncbi:MAG: xanthine dehydrogenase family protein subunit M [Burkholderiaceae bacterium]